MILTFMRGGDIPKQKHIFYRKAFDTLFKHHDDMKFLYKRDYHSELAEDVFIRLWRAFCYFSYIERKFGFDIELMRKFIVKAAEYLSMTVDTGAIADDFIESLCIIVKDGDHYSFLHRSFQEYATATFLCIERVGNLPAILSRLNDNFNDDVLDLAFLSNQELIEQEYILPKVELMLKSFRSRRSVRTKVLLFYTGISPEDDVNDEEKVYFTLGNPGAKSEANAHFFSFVRRSYRPAVDAKLSSKLASWMRKMTNKSRGKRGRSAEVAFQDTPDEVLEISPVKQLVQGYYETLVNVQAEIIERRKHQSNMLKI
ncbi:hypothetical protein FJ938_26845 [Mesorhizobium sp. B2-4-14]|uniref:NACHT domain-containing protein n=1 Tax=Mesorhizobium sp. B2-4-14 TaxID=2589935 RepID=UPI00116FD824|nr:hypothetical protein [Mesorhizobium sp. B2-4-14]TPK96827.1 hypothetical protein FJ938_26845 [Mesorhizobium sp. B2-4-14]